MHTENEFNPDKAGRSADEVETRLAELRKTQPKKQPGCLLEADLMDLALQHGTSSSRTAHVAGCPYCKRRLAGYQRAAGQIHEPVPEVRPIVKLPPRRPGRLGWVSCIAAVAAIVLVGVGLWLLKPTPPEIAARQQQAWANSQLERGVSYVFTGRGQHPFTPTLGSKVEFKSLPEGCLLMSAPQTKAYATAPAPNWKRWHMSVDLWTSPQENAHSRIGLFFGLRGAAVDGESVAGFYTFEVAANMKSEAEWRTGVTDVLCILRDLSDVQAGEFAGTVAHEDIVVADGWNTFSLEFDSREGNLLLGIGEQKPIVLSIEKLTAEMKKRIAKNKDRPAFAHLDVEFLPATLGLYLNHGQMKLRNLRYAEGCPQLDRFGK